MFSISPDERDATVAGLELIARFGPEAPLLGMIAHADAALVLVDALGVPAEEVAYLNAMRDGAKSALDVLRGLPEAG